MLTSSTVINGGSDIPVRKAGVFEDIVAGCPW